MIFTILYFRLAVFKELLSPCSGKISMTATFDLVVFSLIQFVQDHHGVPVPSSKSPAQLRVSSVLSNLAQYFNLD
jgi:hypothetical protein